MYKIRFNLGRGNNYMKWKVTDPEGNITFYDPDKHNIFFFGATLFNRPDTAKKIKEGANKRPCAWIKCRNIIPRLKHELPLDNETEVNQVSYNPRVAPYWRDEKGNNIDDYNIHVGTTSGKKVLEIIMK